MKTARFILVLSALVFCLPLAASRADTWPAGTPVPNAVSGVLTDSGLQLIVNQISSVITVEIVRDMILAANPLVDTSDWWGSAYAEATDVYFSVPITLNTDLTPGGISLHGQINNLAVDFHLDGDVIFIPYSLDGDVTVNSVVLNGLISAWVDGTGYINVDLNVYDLTLNGAQMHISGWPDWLQFILDLIFSAIEGSLHDTLVTTLQDQIPPAIEELLNSLPYNFDFELMGYILHFMTGMQQINFNQSTMSLWMGADLTAEGAEPCGPDISGSYYTPSNVPGYTGTTPGSGAPYQVALALGDDAINRILYSAYDAGMLCYTIDQAFLDEMGIPFTLTSELFGSMVPRLHDYGEFMPLILDLRPQEPPIVTINPPGSPYMLTLSMQHAYMDFYMFAMDRWLRLFTFDGMINSAQLDLDITLENAIHIEISGEVDITTPVIYDELLQLTPDERAAVESVIPMIVQLVLPLMTQAISDIPLPSFAGYGVQVLEMSVHGPENDYIGLFGNLIITESGEEIFLDERPRQEALLRAPSQLRRIQPLR